MKGGGPTKINVSVPPSRYVENEDTSALARSLVLWKFVDLMVMPLTSSFLKVQ